MRKILLRCCYLLALLDRFLDGADGDSDLGDDGFQPRWADDGRDGDGLVEPRVLERHAGEQRGGAGKRGDLKLRRAGLGADLSRHPGLGRAGRDAQPLVAGDRGERVDHYQTKRKTKDGRILTVSLTVSPIRDAAGRIIGASKVARDITDLERHEQVLREANDALTRGYSTSGERMRWVGSDCLICWEKKVVHRGIASYVHMVPAIG